MKTWGPVIAAFAVSLTLGGILVKAGIEWGRLIQRVERLEAEQEYLHGTFEVPALARQ